MGLFPGLRTFLRATGLLQDFESHTLANLAYSVRKTAVCVWVRGCLLVYEGNTKGGGEVDAFFHGFQVIIGSRLHWRMGCACTHTLYPPFSLL